MLLLPLLIWSGSPRPRGLVTDVGGRSSGTRGIFDFVRPRAFFAEFTLTGPGPADTLPAMPDEAAYDGAPGGVSDGSEMAWFCVRTQLKHEHIAAANLRMMPELEVFNPRIRYRRSTRRGPVWFTESLFPSYVFARFNWREQLRLVHHSAGVAAIVHFGTRWPTIPDPVIETLKTQVGQEELRVVQGEPQVGEQVQVSGGSFHGLEGIVTRLVPSRMRVAILLDFLGRQTAVEVALNQVVRLPSGEVFVKQRHAPRS